MTSKHKREIKKRKKIMRKFPQWNYGELDARNSRIPEDRESRKDNAT